MTPTPVSGERPITCGNEADREEGVEVPLTCLYRLGATQQRIAKSYLLEGPDNAVAALRSRLHGTSVSSGWRLEAPVGPRRDVSIAGDWMWLNDAQSRSAARDTLTRAVVVVARTAVASGCRLLPAASRADRLRPWREWVAGDRHEVALVSSAEREVVNNVFRTNTPLIIAMTGRPGIDSTVEPLASRRLADSTEHLTTRYLPSGAERHLDAVADELRRTTGISSLAAMDVHPDTGGTDGLSVSVRCVDAQAFVGSAFAAAILVQALAMHARRLVREGRRQGNTPQRVLERQRQAAVVGGLDARVLLEHAPRRQRTGNEGGNKAEIAVLVAELLEALQPEFGTLEVTHDEVVPLLGWTFVGRQFPRTETEFIVRRSLTKASALADAIANPATHHPAALLDPDESGPVAEAGARWERMCADPPAQPRTGRRPAVGQGSIRRGEDVRTARHTGARARDNLRPQRPAQSKAARGGARTQDLERLRRLGTYREHDAVLPAAAREIGALPHLSSELIPWLGNEHAEAVRSIRSMLRPPGQRRVSTVPAQLDGGSRQVRRAVQLAKQSGSALITVTVGDAESAEVKSAIEALLVSLGEVRACLLAATKYRDKKSQERKVAFDVLLLAASRESAVL